MVYTAPAVPGRLAAWAGPAKAASPPTAAAPMAPAAATWIRRGMAVRLLGAASLNVGLLQGRLRVVWPVRSKLAVFQGVHIVKPGKSCAHVRRRRRITLDGGRHHG